MTKKQHYMTREERYQLEALRRAKISISEIARILGFCRQTIYNELRRGEYEHDYNWYTKKQYSADKGQQVHEYMQTGKGRDLKLSNDYEYAKYLEELILKKKYSPAAALEEAKKKNFKTTVCRTTLYSYIDRGVFRQLTNNDLWEKPRRKKKAEKPEQRVVHPKLPSIEERPQHINDRSEPGHWEMDLIIGKGKTGPVLLTMTERRSREELIFKLPDKKAATIRAVFDRMERRMPDFKQRFKSITTDNGSEFLEYEQLIKSVKSGKRFDIYYCHSYAAWEKGTVENHNRMIRRWFPKGTDFSKITKKRIAAVQDWMNNYPRKVLNWKTPIEAGLYYKNTAGSMPGQSIMCYAHT